MCREEGAGSKRVLDAGFALSGECAVCAFPDARVDHSWVIVNQAFLCSSAGTGSNDLG